jgi:hypothetical protein
MISQNSIIWQYLYNKRVCCISIKGDTIQLNSTLRKVFLTIDGILLVLLGAIFFLALALIYVYSDTKLGMSAVIGIVIVSLLLIFTGVSVFRKNKHGGFIALIFLGAGALVTLYSCIFSFNMISAFAFFFYAAVLALLLLGWKELK